MVLKWPILLTAVTAGDARVTAGKARQRGVSRGARDYELSKSLGHETTNSVIPSGLLPECEVQVRRKGSYPFCVWCVASRKTRTNQYKKGPRHSTKDSVHWVCEARGFSNVKASVITLRLRAAFFLCSVDSASFLLRCCRWRSRWCGRWSMWEHHWAKRRRQCTARMQIAGQPQLQCGRPSVCHSNQLCNQSVLFSLSRSLVTTFFLLTCWTYLLFLVRFCRLVLGLKCSSKTRNFIWGTCGNGGLCQYRNSCKAREWRQYIFAVQRCTVANSLANSSVSGNGKPVILAMQHEGWNGSAASRTLADVGMGDLHSNGSRLKIFSGTANPQLSQVKSLLWFANPKC